jgi:hypothetical protein
LVFHIFIFPILVLAFLIAHREKSFLAVHFLFSPDFSEKVSGFFAADRITTSKQPAKACGKRLATGAVALQHNVVKKAFTRAGVDVDLATSCDTVLSNGNGDELSLHRED